MSVIKYKIHKIIIFAICIIVPLIFFVENSINKAEPTKTIRRLQTDAVIDPEPLLADPQPLVQCAGVHALCIFAQCSPDGICTCKTYDSLYQIATVAIKNITIQQATTSYCTIGQPCDVNEAPICQAILNDEYYVNDQLSAITSAYSWNSFCERAWPTDVWHECNNGLWASCMMAPCTPDPAVAEFAQCKCDVNAGVNIPWIDNDPWMQCQYRNAMKATVPVGFDFGFFMGTDYVFQACERVSPITAIPQQPYPLEPFPQEPFPQQFPQQPQPQFPTQPQQFPQQPQHQFPTQPQQQFPQQPQQQFPQQQIPQQIPQQPFGQQPWRGRLDGRVKIAKK